MRLFYEKKFPYLPEFPVMARRDIGSVPPSVLACHGEWEFQLVLKGKGFYYIVGNIFSFRPNTVLMIKPGQPHYYMTTPEHKIEKWKLIFLPSVLREFNLARLLSAVPCQTLLTEKEAAAMLLLFHSMNDELNRREKHWKDIVRCKMKEFFWMLKRAGERKTALPVINPLVQQMVDYIDASFAQRLNIPGLAARFGYSPGHLSHMFKRNTQFGIKHYLLQRRIAEAKRQLAENPVMKVSAVSESVGFESFGVFNRMFKALVGITPAVYRRNSHLDRRI